MGMRIKKHLCYALGNLKTDPKKCWLVDPRFQDWMLDHSDENYARPQRMFIPFLKWIVDPEKRQEQIDILAQANGPSASDKYGITFGIHSVAKKFLALPEDQQNENNVGNFFHLYFAYDGEFGLRKIFGIIPPEEPKFYRRDDNIDYYEDGGKAKSRVKWLDQRGGFCGIYPHTMMVRIPYKDKIQVTQEDLISLSLPYTVKGEMVNKGDFLPDRIMGGDYNRLTGLWDKKTPAILSNKKIPEIHKTYRPEIFSSVLLWTHYIGLFKDWAKTVNELRPCIYTYWS